MTPEERQAAFEAERRQQLGRLATITRETRDSVLGLLGAAQVQIRAAIANNDSKFNQFQRGQALGAVDAALTRFRTGGNAAWQAGVNSAWSAGADLATKPLAAAGVGVVNQLGRIDTRQLLGIRSFLTGRIADITAEARKKIDVQLGLVLAGAQTAGDATTAIDQILGGGARSRALTITRTELARAYTVAEFETLLAAKARGVPMKKKWRRSGKLHSRLTHDAIDGQVRELDQPFDVGGEQLRFPHDPEASAENTINCGCTLLPHVDSWRTSFPGKKPFSHAEVAADPRKSDLNAAIYRDEIKRFVADPGPVPTVIAAIDTVLKVRMAVHDESVLLSRDTLAKQLRRHPEIEPADYQVVDEALAFGEIIQLDASRFVAFAKRPDGTLLKVVVKSTADGRSVYLLSVYRTGEREVARDRKRGKVVRKGI